MLSIAAPAEAETEPLTVMTYNVYLGGDAGAVLSAPRQEVPSRVGSPPLTATPHARLIVPSSIAIMPGTALAQADLLAPLAPIT